MKRKEAAKEPGNKEELSNRQEVLYAEKHVNKAIKKLQTDHKKAVEHRKKMPGPDIIGCCSQLLGTRIHI